MSEGGIWIDEDIIKSPNDDRNYGFLQLENAMKVLVVSDPSTEKAAAAMSVRVGSYSDPDNIPGLAHLCEHMLFLGTEKYPSENEYSQFLSSHGGSSNAFTTGEFTTFFFDVGSEHLQGALDRFSQFFHCPLFNADSTEREINAVDSENCKNLQVDPWRFSQVSKALSRPGHPYSKFGTGSKYTLETHPQELGLNVREQLLQFHSEHYSSNLMALVVLGKESVNELAVLTQQLFSLVTNRNIPIPEFPIHPYSEDQLQLWIEYAPVKELRKLMLEFPLPDLTSYYHSLPSMYVAHLIGHEGPGSLLSYLKSRGWCKSLCAGPKSGGKGFMFFSIDMDMTVEGEDHIEDIVRAVFQHIAMLRQEEPQEWIFKELADLSAIDFRFEEKPKPRSCVTSLTSYLHIYSPREVLSGSYLVTEYRPDLIELVLNKLQPQFVRVGVMSQRFEGKTSSTEQWYGSQYSAKKIDQSLIESWSNATPIEELHLPAPNEFIPTDFKLVPLDKDEGNAVPKLVIDSEMCKVWYKQDDTFFSPKACVCFRISTLLAYKDPTSCSLASLFVQLLQEDLSEFAYNAELSGIEYDITLTFDGIDVTIRGYNHKQPVLLSKIMSKLSNFTVDKKRFEIEKEILSRSLRNFKAQQPHTHAKYYLSKLTDNFVWTKEELAAALEVTTADQLQLFLPELLSQVHVEALIHGNVSLEGCKDLVAIVENSLRNEAGSVPLPYSQILRHKQIKLPNGSSFCYSATNEVHKSCSIEIYFQIGPEEPRLNILLELLAQVLKEPCFDTLRTKEQLGYIVASGAIRTNGAQGFVILIQSDKPAKFVEKRAEMFLHKTANILSSMTSDLFEPHKKALAMKKTEKPKKLSAESQKYWTEIYTKLYHFNRDEKEVKVLETIALDDLISFFKDHIAQDAPLRRKLTVHVVPEGSRDQSPINGADSQTVNGVNGVDETDFDLPDLQKSVPVMDFATFKNRLDVYPTVKPYIPITLS